MNYPIRTYGHPVLRQKATPIRAIDAALRALAEDMLRTMQTCKGIGLAAQQIGQTIQICTLHIDPAHDVAEPGGPRLNPDVVMPLTLINPTITDKDELRTETEGCLSVPDIWVPIQRANVLTVTFLDLNGEERRLHLKGLMARAVQHELDHLNGMLLVDRMSPVKKITLSAKLKKLRQETEEKFGLR